MARDDLPFDFSNARGPRRGPDVGEAAPAGAAPISITALVAKIKGALAAAFPQTVRVLGEISGLKRHTSGHLYFRLKDAGAALDTIMFRTTASRLKFQPRDGMEVVIEGRVDVYEARGQLQLYAERMTPHGAGALELAFRQMVEKLRAEGLFDPSHKVPLPRFPRAVGVVTSPTGAAVRDIRRTLARRWPAAAVYLVPVLVQGEGAAEEIAQAIRLLDACAARYEIDVLIVGRGGGSLEDLWAFNEEIVARAIFAAATPVISGVGHEVDVTVSDMVADVRAATPTAAAELAVPDREEVRRNLVVLRGRLARRITESFRAGRLALESIRRSSVFRDPEARIRSKLQRVEELGLRLRAALHRELAAGRRRLEPAAAKLAALHPARLRERAAARLADVGHRLAWVLGGRSKREGDRLAAIHGRLLALHPSGRLKLAQRQVESAQRQLEAMSYTHVLRRGFSVTRGEDGGILRSVGQVGAGDRLQTELSDGKINSTVAGKEPKPAGEPAERTAPVPARDGRKPARPKRRDRWEK